MNASEMKIKKICIDNFKGISHLELDFCDRFNVIIGNNGTGKTSILEAISVALGGFIAGIDGIDTVNFTKDEVRMETHAMGDASQDIEYHLPIKVKSNIVIDGVSYEFLRQKRRMQSSRSTIEPRDIVNHSIKLVNQKDSILPVISYQGFARIANQKKAKWESKKRSNLTRIYGYEDCLDEASNTKQLTSWCQRMEFMEWKRGEVIGEYSAVKIAINNFIKHMMIADQASIKYDNRVDELVIMSDDKVLPLRFFSSGIRTMLGMILDISYRMAVLNPQLKEKASLETPGIVLIDEIDMHLHPSWQWRIVEAMKRTFPMIQFVVTTHSPMVIGSCAVEDKIISLKNGTFFDEELIQKTDLDSYIGWQVNDVLSDIMKSNIRDENTVKLLKKLKDLAIKKHTTNLEDHEYSEYDDIINKLKAVLPEGDLAVEEITLFSIDDIWRNINEKDS